MELGTGAVHPISQLLAGLEGRDAPRGDLDGLTRLGIAARASGRFTYGERAEPAQVDAISLRETIGDGFDERVDRGFDLWSREVPLLCDHIHQISLLHGFRFLLVGATPKIPPRLLFGRDPRDVVRARANVDVECRQSEGFSRRA